MRRLLSLFFYCLSLLCFLVALERPAKADPVTATLGGASLFTNILGGIMGRGAANKAAELQAASAERAGNRIIGTTNDVNPNILSAASASGENMVDTSNDAAAGVLKATRDANGLLPDWTDTGNQAIKTIGAGIVPGGDFNKTPTLADLQIDPGYNFRTSEAQKAIQASAAAKGGVLGGGVLKALTNYSQDAASQEYQKAFDRFRTSTQDRFNNLLSVSDRGQQAATTQGDRLIDSATYGGNARINAAGYQGDAIRDAAIRTSQNSINAADAAGNYETQGANAKAAGIVGGSNALWNGINGGVSSAADIALLSRLLKNPSRGFGITMGKIS